MPKTPIDYSKTIIYRIVCKDVSIKESYVGATTDFTRRKSNHKSICNNVNNIRYNFNVYQFIRNNGGWENWDMIEIEKYDAIDKLDSDKKERYWLEYYNAKLNTSIPSQTHTEYNEKYYQEHKELFAEYNKEYYQKNIEDRTKYFREFYQEHKEKIAENGKETITCECGSICRKRDISRHKQTKKHLAFTGNTINVCDSGSNISSIRDKLEPEGF